MYCSYYSFVGFFAADQIPYNVTVFGANSAGNGSVGEKIVFTAEGSKTHHVILHNIIHVQYHNIIHVHVIWSQIKLL